MSCRCRVRLRKSVRLRCLIDQAASLLAPCGLGAEARGYPLMLGLNPLYGKTAQRTGRCSSHDATAAGLVTAMTRARLIEAVAQHPKAVVMLATDTVFSTCLTSFDIGDRLVREETSRPISSAARRSLVPI